MTCFAPLGEKRFLNREEFAICGGIRLDKRNAFNHKI
jgi:hypothetical protein